MAVFVCYYLRIPDIKTREELEEEMNKILRELSFKGKDFLEIPIKEELYVIDNIELEKGIAKNRALLDNIFSLFVAINNKVPIFIVGKPGCSKSLSVQLINKSMKGDSSKKSLFKDLPKIILSSYQGSMSSTSQGVENVFNKARRALKRLKKIDRKNNISMIYFDEMGLAEHSPNNPLKVIHAELEYDQNKGSKKIAFVGISNWALDASKMNRGMFLSIPEPCENDTKETAFTIGKSYDENMANQYKFFFENLGLTYYKYKNYLKKIYQDGKEDFHGNRDFYHLIKNAARNIVENYRNKIMDTNILEKIAITSIERNFGGLRLSENTTSIKIIKEILSAYYAGCRPDNCYQVVKRIKENISDLKSRYLLVISKSSISAILLSSILSDLKKDFKLYIGSQFQNDLKSEEYSLKILNKIQLHMEQGNVLILKNLESVYPALYDLFNQNFTEVSKKNYARIAIGSSTNTFSFVGQNFRCIVNVDYDQIDQEEAPFLNRFEKHIVSFDYLLDNGLIEESHRIYKILNELIEYDKKKFKGINYSLKKLFINLDLEEIQGIIYEEDKKDINEIEAIPYEENKKDIINSEGMTNEPENKEKIEKKNNYLLSKVISKISLILPQDILVCLKLNTFKSKYEDISNQIVETYDKGEHNNMRNFLEKMTNTKNVVYTFSNNLDLIENLDNINNPKFGLISDNNIKQIKISSYKSENEFEKEIDDFLEEDKYKLCFIKFNANEGSFLNYVKFFIENKEKDFMPNQKREEQSVPEKIFIFIVYLIRVLNTDLDNLEKKPKKFQNYINKKLLKETISFSSGYYQIFIDNLNGIWNFNLKNIFELKGIEFFEKFLNFDKELKKNIYFSLSYIKYNIPFSYGELNEDTYVNKLIHYIEEKKDLRDHINMCIKLQLNKEDDLIVKILKKSNLVSEEDRDLIQVIKNNLLNEYKKCLNLLYLKAEKDNFFSSLLSAEEEIKLNKNNPNLNIFREKTNLKYFENVKINNKIKIIEEPGKNVLNIILGLKLPGLKPTLDSLLIYIQNEIEKKYKINENKLRSYKGKTASKAIERYNKELEILNNSLYNELNKNNLISKIIEDNEVDSDLVYEFCDTFLEDYYTLFIYKNINNTKENNRNESSKKKDIDNIKNMLKYIVELKKDNKKEEKQNHIKDLAKTLNWIQCYSDEITTILQMFSKLNTIIEDLLDLIKNVIITGEIKYETTYESNESSSIVNKALFLSMESILRVITSKENIYIALKENPDEFSELMKINKEILQHAFKLEANLHLYTKEAFSLEEIIEINQCFYNNQIDTAENISNIIKFFSKETKLISLEYQNELINNFNELYKFLEKSIGEDEYFPKTMSIIIKNECHKTSLNEYMANLLNIMMSKNEFVYNSYSIIKLIFKFSNKPEDMKKNLKNLQNDKDELLKALNNSKMIFLDETIINFFEYKIISFFKRISNLDFEKNESYKEDFKKYYTERNKKENENKNIEWTIVYDLPNNIFNDCYNLLDSIMDNETIKNKHLCELYAITYIKIYLNKLIFFMFNNYDEMSSVENLLVKIAKNNNSFGKIIKIYIFKLYFNLFNKNWEKFLNYNFKFHQIDFCDILEEKEEENTKNYNLYSFLMNYLLIIDSVDEENDFLNENKKFEIIRKKNFSDCFDENYVQYNNLDIFLAISMNKIISNLGLENNPNINEYNDFSQYSDILFRNFGKNIKDLIFLFYKEKTFNEKLKPKIEQLKKNIKIGGEPFESLLYGFRFCLQSLLKNNVDDNNNEKYLYSSILSHDCLNAIQNYFIPGNHNARNLKLETLSDIERNVKKNPGDTGCYVCSCGYYYIITPCGFPTEGYTSNCPICQLPIGYGEKKKEGGAKNHGMVVRPGHFRIFKDTKQKQEQMGIWQDLDDNIPNMTLEEYKKTVIEPLKNEFNKGINVVIKEIYLSNNRTIRKLSQIGFRILNFILYNHLFFSNCLDYISKIKLEEKLVKGMNILEIIQINWNLLEEALKEKGISSIRVFMNSIYKELSELIKNCKCMTDINELMLFEEEIECLIQKKLESYPDYNKKYSDINQKLLALKPNNIRAIISEIFPPLEDLYPETEYPYLKYFTYTKYRTIDDLNKALGPEEEYCIPHPLLYNYLKNSEGPRKLKYLYAFNDFTNYMTETYSYLFLSNIQRKS